MDKNSSGIERRSFLKALGIMSITPMAFGQEQFGGWLPPTRLLKRSFYEVSDLRNFGKNKRAFLSQAYKKVTGKEWTCRFQFRGDCAGVGTTTAIDYVNVTQTLQKKSSWQGNHSIVGHYIGAREQAKQDPRGDGARTEWFVDFFRDHGVLLAKKYGQDDLRQWNQETYNNFSNGLTDNLLFEANKHPLLHAERVRSYEEARDAIASGYPVAIGSYLGVGGVKKDKDGFFYPRGTSVHLMCCIGMEDKERPSILIQNSHGPNWAPGPKRYGFEPEGSAWLDAEHFNKYVNGFSDSWTLSLFEGYKVERKYIFW